MNQKAAKRDLYVLTADQDISHTMEALLENPAKIGIRPITYAIGKHLQRDPGCRTGASDYLRPYMRRFEYALVVFDRHGCGDPSSRSEIRGTVENGLTNNGWKDRSRVVVIDPELETWIWNGSNQVTRVIGWPGRYQDLKSWLSAEGLWPSDSPKPPEPKKALRAVLRKQKERASSALFGKLARSITIRGCQDPAFNELIGILRTWFPSVHSL